LSAAAVVVETTLPVAVALAVFGLERFR